VIREEEALSRSSLTPPGPGEASGVLSFEIGTVSARAWDVELRQSLAAPLRRGETLLVSFDFRISPGYAFSCYWQQDSPPWPKLVSARLAEPVDQWHTCTLAVAVPSDFGPRQTSLCFHLAGAVGTVQFRGLSAAVYPSGVIAGGQPNCDMVLGGDYQDRDWEQKMLERLREVRRAELTVRVTKGGKPVPGATVTIRQKSRPFFIGAEVPAALLAEGEAVALLPGELRSTVEGLGARIGGYRAKVLDRRLFDVLSPRDMLVWRESQAWGDTVAPTIIQQALARGLRVRGHALYCPALSWAPPDCRRLPAPQFRESLVKYIAQQVGRYRGKVFQWDVVHAPLTNDETYARIGEESLAEAFKVAREQDPDATLVLSDNIALVAAGSGQADELVDLVHWLRSKGGAPDAVALQLGMAAPFVGPQAIEQRLDLIAAGTGLPIVVTSLALESAGETAQAFMLEKLLNLLYSHPAVAGVCLSRLWEAEKGAERSAIFRLDLSPKPAAMVLEKLVVGEWMTNVDARTDARGTAAVSVFQGTHAVAAAEGGRTASEEVVVPKGGSAVTIELPE